MQLISYDKSLEIIERRSKTIKSVICTADIPPRKLDQCFNDNRLSTYFFGTGYEKRTV